MVEVWERVERQRREARAVEREERERERKQNAAQTAQAREKTLLAVKDGPRPDGDALRNRRPLGKVDRTAAPRPQEGGPPPAAPPPQEGGGDHQEGGGDTFILTELPSEEADNLVLGGGPSPVRRGPPPPPLRGAPAPRSGGGGGAGGGGPLPGGPDDQTGGDEEEDQDLRLLFPGLNRTAEGRAIRNGCYGGNGVQTSGATGPIMLNKKSRQARLALEGLGSARNSRSSGSGASGCAPDIWRQDAPTQLDCSTNPRTSLMPQKNRLRQHQKQLMDKYACGIARFKEALKRELESVRLKCEVQFSSSAREKRLAAKGGRERGWVRVL